ncbi:MAG TPA: outer membrane beta-barrel protein [Xanthobacteraceae bacterium]
MKKLLLTTTTLLMVVSGSAMAADLSRPPPAAPVYTKAPMMAPLFTWTGCYVGGNGGGVWARKTLTTASAVSVNGVPFATGASEGSLDINGGVAGGQVGCNYQMGTWVIGAQGDFDWSSAKSSVTDTVFGTSDSVKIKSLASVTGRVGYAWDRFLLYAKGGGAWETDDYSATSAFTSLTVSDTRTGWTVGGGGEYAFTDWLTGFVEYDYYDFGTKTETFAGTLGPIVGTVAVSVKETKSVAKAGLNFKFGGWR